MSDVKILNQNHLNAHLMVILGTRPGIIMFAPILKALQQQGIAHKVIHTGQHYSANMDEYLFNDLAMPSPHYRLQAVSQFKTHAGQTAAMLCGIEELLMQEKPWLVLVGGDANTNLAGALAARKLGLKVGHIEAGERSYDWRMPEEHNRRMIDHISDFLFATSEKAKQQLLKESVQGKIFVTGNPIVDASLQHYQIAKQKSQILSSLNLTPQRYILLTTHREENVDVEVNLRGIIQGAAKAASALNLPVVFPIHPRTAKRLTEFNLTQELNSYTAIQQIEAVGYLDFLNLLSHASLVLTDSGGIQQEACIHHIPCVTVRDNTEWTETLTIHANCLAGCNPDKIAKLCAKMRLTKKRWPIPFGQGDAAQKIVNIVKQFYLV